MKPDISHNEVSVAKTLPNRQCHLAAKRQVTQVTLTESQELKGRLGAFNRSLENPSRKALTETLRVATARARKTSLGEHIQFQGFYPPSASLPPLHG